MKTNAVTEKITYVFRCGQCRNSLAVDVDVRDTQYKEDIAKGFGWEKIGGIWICQKCMRNE